MGSTLRGEDSAPIADHVPTPKRTRRVAAHTCEPCTLRKKKCNKKIPCDQCIARKLEHRCRLYVPKREPPLAAQAIDGSTMANEEEDVMSSAWRLETEDNIQLPGQTEVLPEWLRAGYTPPSATHPWEPSTGSQEPSQSTSTAQPSRTHIAEDVLFRQEVLDRLSKLEAAQASFRPVHHADNLLRNAAPFASPLSESASTAFTSSASPTLLDKLYRTYGVTAPSLNEALASLPTRQLASALTDHYFETMNPLRWPISEPWFRRSLEGVYAVMEHFQILVTERTRDADQDHALVKSLSTLPLVYTILAFAAKTVSADLMGGHEAREEWSVKFYWASRKTAPIAASIRPESVDLVVNGFLVSMYLMIVYDRKVTQAWGLLGAAVRGAQSVGLHRDGSKLGMDPIETEHRRRIWSYIYHAERHYALIIGRPASIHDAFFDTKEPLNIDLDQITETTTGELISRPLSETTSSTYLILRFRFAKITGRIAYHFYKLNEPATYSEVKRLDEEIMRFIESLPPQFRLECADRSMDLVRDTLPIHRYMLGTEVTMTRIMLHRPWLLRKLWSDEHAYSRQACFESAKLDYQMRQSLARSDADRFDMHATSTFRDFNTAMVAGMAAIMYPTGSDACIMRQIMAAFLDKHPVDKQGNEPRTTQKEVAIIYTLYRRAVRLVDHPNEIDYTGADDAIVQLFGTRTDTATLGPGEDEDADLSSRPQYGDDKALAILIRDLYAIMVKRNVAVAQDPDHASRTSGVQLASTVAAETHNMQPSTAPPPIGSLAEFSNTDTWDFGDLTGPNGLQDLLNSFFTTDALPEWTVCAPTIFNQTRPDY